MAVRASHSVWTPLEHAIREHPDRWAVVDGERRVTYAELGQQVFALARHLRAQGLAPGDRVSALLRNSHAYLVTYFAAAAAGLVCNPLNHRLAPKELAFILEDAGSRWLVAHGDQAEQVAAVRKRCGVEGVLWVGAPQADEPSFDRIVAEPAADYTPTPGRDDELAHLYYTSGTTGRPKGVMLTHRNVCVHARGTIDELQLSQRDVWGHVAPMFHLADAWATFAITWVGGVHVMVGRFDPREVLETIGRHRVTVTNLIPTMLNQMVNEPTARDHDVSSLRLLMSGGAPIAPALVRRIVDTFGCEYVQTYGMTETSPYLTLSLLRTHLRELPPNERLVFQAKTGRPFTTVELRVVDPAGRPVAADGEQVGEIQVRGESVTPGYWNRPEETAAAFVDGWLRTGDLAVLDREGYVDIVDRLKDMIISGGENIYSTEVEHVLYLHSAVLEAAVIGVPDERWGEAVQAVVVLKPDAEATAEELIVHCKEHLAGYKAPRRIAFRDSLPRTGSGKVRKQSLRERVK
ncbi:MAG: long-chain-fatty-acid--CoA ligase [bacterium]